MKKTTSITIENTVFHLEEDAYVVLERYLASVREHFAKNGDSKEIMRDIEARIAERFSESPASIVTIDEVNAVIADMGTIDQFDDQAAADEGAAPASPSGARKLYRDTDSALFAGVSSGLANYFNADPIVFRVAFVILAFVSGFGILAYLLLWIIVPEAKTAAQKLAMKGNPVTLASMSRVSSARSEAMGFLRRAARFLERNLFRFVRLFVGALLAAGAFASITALTIGAGIAAFGDPTSLFDPVLAPLFEGALFPLMVLACFGALLIPLIVIGASGLGLLLNRNVITKRAFGLLAGIWFIALVASGITAFHAGYKGSRLAENDPGRDYVTEQIETQPFTRIEARNGSRIALVKGSTFAVSVEGEKRAIDGVSVSSNEGTLMIEKKESMRDCLFCSAPSPEITVTLPGIDGIILENGSRISGWAAGQNLDIALRNGSRAELDIDAVSFSLSLENASFAELSGTTTAAAYTLKNGSTLKAEELHSDTVTISAENASRAELDAATSLSAKAKNGSRVTNHGEAAESEDADDSSQVEEAE